MKEIENGYIQTWHSDFKDWDGTNVEDPRKLEYVRFIIKAQSVPLQDKAHYLSAGCENFYEGKSGLLGGLILSHEQLKKGKEEKFNGPKTLVKIIGEKEKDILTFAERIGLPVKEEFSILYSKTIKKEFLGK